MRRKILIGLVAVLAVTGFATPANAAASDCPTAFVCLFKHNSYSGPVGLSEFDIGNYGLVSPRWVVNVDDDTSSVINNGTSCAVRLFERSGFKGRSFSLNSPKFPNGKSTRDPNLSNGAGGVVYNFNDKLTSHYWHSCE